MNEKPISTHENVTRPDAHRIKAHLVTAQIQSEEWGGEARYVGQDSNGGIFVTDDPNDGRAIRWLAKVEALPEPDGSFYREPDAATQSAAWDGLMREMFRAGCR